MEKTIISINKLRETIKKYGGDLEKVSEKIGYSLDHINKVISNNKDLKSYYLKICSNKETQNKLKTIKLAITMAKGDLSVVPDMLGISKDSFELIFNTVPELKAFFALRSFENPYTLKTDSEIINGKSKITPEMLKTAIENNQGIPCKSSTCLGISEESFYYYLRKYPNLRKYMTAIKKQNGLSKRSDKIEKGYLTIDQIKQSIEKHKGVNSLIYKDLNISEYAFNCYIKKYPDLYNFYKKFKLLKSSKKGRNINLIEEGVLSLDKIKNALEKFNGNRVRSSKFLDINPNTLYNYMKKYPELKDYINELDNTKIKEGNKKYIEYLESKGLLQDYIKWLGG